MQETLIEMPIHAWHRKQTMIWRELDEGLETARFLSWVHPRYSGFGLSIGSWKGPHVSSKAWNCSIPPFIRELPDANKHHAAITNQKAVISVVLIFAARVVNFDAYFSFRGNPTGATTWSLDEIINVLPLQATEHAHTTKEPDFKRSGRHGCDIGTMLRTKFPKQK